MSKVLQEKGFGSLPSSTKINPRDQVKAISTTIKTDSHSIRHIGSSQYAVSIGQNRTSLYKLRQTSVPFPSHLEDHYYEEEGNYGPKFTKAYKASNIKNTIPRKEKYPESFTLPCFINDFYFDNALVDLGASVSVMPLSTYLNLGLGELAHTRLTVELADRTVKYPKGIAETHIVDLDLSKLSIVLRRLGTWDREDSLGRNLCSHRTSSRGPSPACVKENIDVLRTMIKELGNRGQEKVTPRKLFNEESGGVGSRRRGRPRSAQKNRKSVSKKKGISKSHRSVRSEAQSRSKSKSVKSKPQPVRASQRKSSLDSRYDTVSDSGSEDLSMPYRRPKPMPFTSRITHFRYHQRAKLPPNVRVYEGNKDLEDHLTIFSAATEQEEWPMPVWCKMFCQTPSGSARNWFDSLDLKSVDEFEDLSTKFLEEFSQQKRYDKDPTEIHGIKQKPNEGLQAFMDRFKLGLSLGEKRLQTQLKPLDLLGGKRVLVKLAGRKAKMGLEIGVIEWGEGRNMGTCAPYARKEGFTPLMKTPKEILAMDNVNFLPPPLMIEEAVASGRLAHLVKDIRQGGW
ncbi:reverse transcriptase domain-containing protein [Tanacetum coccineum]